MVTKAASTIIALALALGLGPQAAPLWAGPAAAAPQAHREAQCADCHSGGRASARRTRAVARRCQTCHDPATLAKGAAAIHGQGRGRCLECHSFHEPAPGASAAANGAAQIAGGLENAHCRSCHDPRGNLGNLSPAHRTAAGLYHTQAKELQHSSPSQACLNCHSNLTATAWQGKTDGAVLAFNEHASHPYGVRVTPGAGDSSNWIAWQIDKRLPLFDGRLECQTCHLLSAGTEDLVIPFPTKYGLCKGCHRHYGDDDPGNVLVRAGN